MKISERQAGDVTILDVEGRIMYGDGEEEFRDAVTSALDADRVKLVINMAGVPFIDSAGISQLVRTFVTCKRRGGAMRLLGISERVRDLLDITRLLTVWEAFDTEEEAVGAFGPAPRAT